MEIPHAAILTHSEILRAIDFYNDWAYPLFLLTRKRLY